MRLLFLCGLLIAAAYSVQGQDVQALVKAKPVKITGGIGLDNVYYNATGLPDRRNLPYQYYLTGNLNIVLFGQVQLPFSFNYSNQKLNYSQPFNQQQFNQFGISPKYKWITLHAGWRSMTFSPYSLSGHTFLGGGAELTPGKFKIAAMYGRLMKPVQYDTTESGSPTQPVYKRIGAGANVQYLNNGDIYGISVFRASDQISSLNNMPDSIGVTPMDNLVLGAQLKKSLWKSLMFDGQYGRSVLTQDTRPDSEETTTSAMGLIKTNASTVIYHAYKLDLSYKFSFATIGVGYERVDPGYRTLGAYYFNNDLENITGKIQTSFFKKKLNLGLNAGKQRNNLDNSKLSEMSRWVFAANIGWQITKKLNVSINLSNFRSYTNMTSPFNLINTTQAYPQIDTLNYRQISYSSNTNIQYQISQNEKRTQNFNLNGSYQKSTDEQGGKELNTGSSMYNLVATYTIGFVPKKLAFNLTYNYNLNDGAQSNAATMGPTLGINKGFFKNAIRSTVSYSYNQSNIDNKNTGTVGVLRWTNTFTLKKKHTFNLSISNLNKHSKVANVASFNEFTLRFGYNFRF